MCISCGTPQGETVVENLLDSDDVTYMLGALKCLGIAVTQDEGTNTVTVAGCGGSFPVGRAGGEGGALRRVDLFLGNAGTAMRPLTAAVAVAGGQAE